MKLSARFEVDFSHEKNLSKLLGFQEETYSRRTQIASEVHNLLPIKEYIVHADVVDSRHNILNGHRCNILDMLPAKYVFNNNERTTYIRQHVYYKYLQRIYNIDYTMNHGRL